MLGSLAAALHAAREGTGEVRRILLSATFRPRLPGAHPTVHVQQRADCCNAPCANCVTKRIPFTGRICLSAMQMLESVRKAGNIKGIGTPLQACPTKPSGGGNTPTAAIRDFVAQLEKMPFVQYSGPHLHIM